VVTKVPVCMEAGPDGTGTFVPSCPGCWVFGRTPERALSKVKIAVADWFDWLEEHGEHVSEGMKNFEVEVAELLRVDYNPVKAGKPEPLFWSEVPRVTRKDVLRTLRLMRYSREDLIKAVSKLSRNCLNWEPPGEPRTIEDCLRHIAYVEPWYVSRLGSDLKWKHQRDVFKMLDSTREAVTDYLKRFPREKMKGIFQPTRDLSPVCNLWTARKVLRRLVDHERLHTKYVEKITRMYREKQ
jgi:predicted RNase H-like HicB family nuclease